MGTIRKQAHAIAALAILVAGASYLRVAEAAPGQDGQRVFAQKCAMCHVVAGKGGKIGPDLSGVVGRKAASTAYAYSPALKKLATKWTPDQLDKFLAGPTRFAPGTKMTIAVPSPKDRQAVIAYLQAQRK